MNDLNQIVYVDKGARPGTAVGIVNDYINLDESETAALLYQRLNRDKVRNHLTLSECTEYAQEIRNGTLSEYLTEAKELSSGIFWVITDDRDFDDYKLLFFDIPSDPYGNHHGTHKIALNAKSGGTYNHKKLWESEIKNNSAHKPYNKKDYNYYPRGRVEISNNKATIYINPNINVLKITNEIKRVFGLNPRNIADIRIVNDGGSHYKCWMD